MDIVQANRAGWPLTTAAAFGAALGAVFPSRHDTGLNTLSLRSVKRDRR